MATYSATSRLGTFTVSINTTSSSITVVATSESPHQFAMRVAGQNYSEPGDTTNFSHTFSGLQSSTGYGIQVWTSGGDDLTTYAPTEGSGGGGGQGGSAGGAGDLGEKITTFDWNSTNWGTARTVWAEEHGTGSFNDYGGRYDDSGYAVVPGYSINKGWVSPSQTYDKYQGTLYAKSTSGADLAVATVTDSEVTINLTTRARSRLYANFPWHGMRVVYEDDDGEEVTYFDNKTSQSGLTNSNSSWSGTITDAYWCPLTTSWSNVPVSIPYQRGETDKVRKIKVQLYGDIGGFISTSDGTKEFRTFVNTLQINVTVPAIEGYRISVNTDGHGSATVTDGTTTDTSIVVQTNTSVTCSATAQTDYVFSGWYNGSTDALVSSNNPYTFNASANLDLIAKFEEDLTDKAMYLNEIMTTNKSYRLIDGSAVHGSGTSGKLVKWDTAKTMGDAPTITGSTTAPSSLSSGDIVAYNSEDYPNESGWTWGNEAIYESSGQTGDKIRAGLKVVFQSETATTYTIRVYCMLSQNAGTLNSSQNLTWRYYENGVNMTPYNGNPNLPSGTSVYTNYTSDTNFGAWFKGLNSWQELVDYPNQWSCPKPVSDATGGNNTTCNYYKDVVIQKTNTFQNFEVKNTVKYYPRSESLDNTWSEVVKIIAVPPIGYSAAVGYNDSVRVGRTYVKYNNSWHDAIMWVNVNGTWVKGHYYTSPSA